MPIASPPDDKIRYMKNHDNLKHKVQQGYDTSAHFYDETVGHLYIQYADQLLRDLTIPDNPTALDVGCGTGIATFQLHKKCHGRGRFHGIDLSSGMIAQATQNAKHYGYTNCVFRLGDAEHLAFPDNMFDLVISNVVLQWIPDKHQALSEMCRVLKSRGQVALRFGGEGAFQESFTLLIRLAANYPDYPILSSFTAMRDNFISLEQAQELFDTVGFHDARAADPDGDGVVKLASLR